MVSNESKKIMLVDDHGIMRDGLKALIERQSDLAVLGEADNGHDAIEMTSRLMPDVVLIDVKMPKMDGIEASRQILKKNPDVRIILFSGEMSKFTIEQAIRIGVSGLILKDSIFETFVNAIRSVIRDERFFCPEIRSIVAESYARILRNGNEETTTELSKDEHQVVQLLSEGKSIGQIAMYFNKSPKTIDARKRKIMSKLGVSNMVELTKYAIQNGMTTVEY